MNKKLFFEKIKGMKNPEIKEIQTYTLLLSCAWNIYDKDSPRNNFSTPSVRLSSKNMLSTSENSKKKSIEQYYKRKENALNKYKKWIEEYKTSLKDNK